MQELLSSREVKLALSFPLYLKHASELPLNDPCCPKFLNVISFRFSLVFDVKPSLIVVLGKPLVIANLEPLVLAPSADHFLDSSGRQPPLQFDLSFSFLPFKFF